MRGPNLHPLQEKLGIGGSFPKYGAVLGAGFLARACLSLSYPFQSGHFLSQLMCWSRSAGFWVSVSVQFSVFVG